jgi:hypothetical protein
VKAGGKRLTFNGLHGVIAQKKWRYRSTIHDLGFTPRLYTRGKEPLVPTEQEATWTPRAGLKEVKKIKILPLPEIEPRPSSP